MKLGVYSFGEGKEPKDLEKQIKVLKKQLEIAVECLEYYGDECLYEYWEKGYEIAQDALKQIKELDK